MDLYASVRATAVAGAIVAAGLAPARTVRAESDVFARLDIGFSASSTLHDFEGAAPPLDATVTPEPEASKLWRAEVDVPVASITTDNDSRDEKMREMFDVERFPTIRGTVRNVDPEAVRTGGRLPVRVRIREVEKELQATVSNWQASPDKVEFDAAFDLSLVAFELKAPRVLFIRVADLIRVKVHVTVTSARP